jgi:hypothetical protein
VLADDGIDGPEFAQLPDDTRVGDGGDFDGDGRPGRQQPGLVFPVIGDADEFPAAARHQFLLEQTGAAALDAVEVGVDFVGAVEGDFDLRRRWERVEGDGRQACFLDLFAAVPACGDEPVDVAGWRGMGFLFGVLSKGLFFFLFFF